jgi:uncharacterized membrane protein YbhN (UPF0104 family)
MSATRDLLARVQVRRIAICALVLVVMGAAATLFGWEIGSWFERLWNTVTSIPAEYILAGIVLLTIQTIAAGFAWYSILRFAYPHPNLGLLQVLACYATAVALNFVLPANLGSLVMMIMFTTLIAAATFAGIIGGFLVQKIFFTVIGAAVYVYLFSAVRGSFDLQFGFVESHPWATVILVVGTAALLLLVGRILKPRILVWWDRAKDGGQILAYPRSFFGRVVFPEAVSWVAMLGVIAVFLAAYDIPVSFHTLMRVVGGNSIANMTSVTPGAAGVTQGFNALSLKGVTSTSNATRYSVAQQLVTTAWSILLALVLLIRAFGWSGGKALVEESYGEAREKRAEQLAERKARRAARRRRLIAR